MLFKKTVRKRKYIYRIYWKQIHLYVHPGSSKLCCPRLSIVKWLHNKAHQHDLMTSGTQVNARPSGAVLRMQDKGRPSRGLVLVALGQLHLQARLVWLVQCFKNNFFRAVHLWGHAGSTPVLIIPNCHAQYPAGSSYLCLLLGPWRWLIV